MENSEECKTANQNYVSCIKIHGLEILPPIISEEKRKCMQYYKNLAIQIEEKIKLRKFKRIHNESTESENSATFIDSEISSISDSVTYSSDKSSSNEETTFKSQVFSDSCRSDVLHMLNDSKNNSEFINNMHAVELPLLDTPAIKNVPLHSNFEDESDIKKCFESDIAVKPVESLTIVTQDSLNTSETNNDLTISIHEQLTNSKTNITLVEKESNETDDSNQNVIKNNETPVDDSVVINNNDKCIEEIANTDNKSLNKKSPLIRSNSYILENPSPYLLALINQNNTDNLPKKPLNSSGHKRRRWNLVQAKEKWSSIEQDLNNSQKRLFKRNINFNSLPTSKTTSPENKMFNSSLVITPIKNISKDISKSQLPEKELDIPTNDKPKYSSNSKFSSIQHVRGHLINGTDSKSSEASSRFFKSSVTPVKKTNLQRRVDTKQISPVKPQSIEKTKKSFDCSMINKKSDLLKNSGSKQPKVPLDEIKRTSPSIKPNIGARRIEPNRSRSVSGSEASLISTKSPEKSTKFVKSNSLKNITSSSLVSKKPNTITSNIQEQQIRDIITKVNLEQSNQMAILLEKQRAEQEHLIKLFTEQQALLLTKLRCTYQTMNSPFKENSVQTEPVIQATNQLKIEPAFSTAVLVDLNKSENLVMECRKVIDYEASYAGSSQNSMRSFPSSPEDSIMSISPNSNQIERSIISSQQYSLHIDFNRNTERSDLQIIDLELSGCHENNQFSNEDFCPTSASSSKYTTDSLELDIINPIEIKRNSIRIAPPCSRQLFPTEKQIWAATRLCAATRGFLVRRLIKTERVQNLIQTIRDSLLCAMELHHEKADNIQLADVELHRRLIQQVTAACYTFHDTFFELKIPEQMSIIALDRERQKEKSLRPFSAKSNSSLTLTTQKFLERKLNRRSSDSVSGLVNQSRCSSSRSSYNMGDFRPRTKSLSSSEQKTSKKISPQNDAILHRAMRDYGANKKPWR